MHDDFVQTVSAKDQDDGSTFPDNDMTTVFVGAVADSPAEAFFDPTAQCVILILDGFANDGNVVGRLVGFVVFTLSRGRPPLKCRHWTDKRLFPVFEIPQRTA